MKVRDADADDRFWVVTMRDGTNWLAMSFPTKEKAIEEAQKIGYGGPWYITEAIAVLE